jgi:hypothetical protein
MPSGYILKLKLKHQTCFIMWNENFFNQLELSLSSTIVSISWKDI